MQGKTLISLQRSYINSPEGVVLLSGGLHSTIRLAVAKRPGFDIHALSVRYGQRHQHEVETARRIAKRHGVARSAAVDIDLRVFRDSALTADITAPKDRPASVITRRQIPEGKIPQGRRLRGPKVNSTHAQDEAIHVFALRIERTTGEATEQLSLFRAQRR